MLKDYDDEEGTVAIVGKGWLSLREVFEGVQNGTIDPEKVEVPDYPIAGKGWYRADKAYEILNKANSLNQ